MWFQILLILMTLDPTSSMAVRATPSSKDPKPANLKKIFILGDSLTEGYGVDTSEAYPQQLQIKIDQFKPQQYQVVAAGVSGSTTASGLSRLKWLMKARPSLVILALGSNDALRGLDVEATQKNVQLMIEYLKKENTPCILVGFQAPPNYGRDYAQKFQSIWVNLKAQYKLTFIPFLLEGVAGEKEFNIEDGIHPNPKGHQKMAETVFAYIKDLL
jgi:acyl-CoA thioesterase-1